MLIIQPAALILSLIGPYKLTLARALIIDPVAHIAAPIRIDHASMSVMLAVRPVAFIARAILPYLQAAAMSTCSTPLPQIRGILVVYLD